MGLAESCQWETDSMVDYISPRKENLIYMVY